MTNEILFVVSLVAAFSSIVIVARLFGIKGIIASASICAVAANIITAKQIHLFGVDVSMGAVLFSCVYLCTDIISEVSGKEKSRETVYIVLAAVVFSTLSMWVATLFKPSQFDFASSAMSELFSMSIRISTASIAMFFLSNICDVYLFDTLKKASPKTLWLRNNVSTIFCNCAENFLFIIGAFLGVYTFAECISIAAATCVVECITAILDTPFVYLGRKYCKLE